jgi:ubiquinone/menaquinone biosynthesis C-methylase UbiE
MFASQMQFQMWAEFSYSVETGQRAFDKVFGMPVFEYLSAHPKAGRVFNEAMVSMSFGASRAVIESYDFTGIQKLVDVGGGHGFLLASILKKYPAMRGILFDTQPVMEEAKAILLEHGVANRCETMGGDFFKAVPPGCDAYLMKHILHDWNQEQCVAILRNCRQGIKSGGKVLVVEMLIPEGNEASMSTLSDLQMLAILPGQERTLSEYQTLFNQAGFELARIVSTQSPYSILEGVTG